MFSDVINGTPELSVPASLRVPSVDEATPATTNGGPTRSKTTSRCRRFQNHTKQLERSWSACHSPAAELFPPLAEEILLEDVDVLLLPCSRVKESFPGDVVATLSDSVVGFFSMVVVELSPSKIVVVEVLPSLSAE